MKNLKYSKIAEFASHLNCEVVFNELLSRHTTFKVGGPADVFIYVYDESSLSSLIKKTKDNFRVFVLGKGSNLIADEKGFRGLIIKLDGNFKKVKLDDNKIICGAGATLASACVAALNGNLSGLEFAWGIPGTCGGALYMNAGAYGGEISDIIYESTHMDSEGEFEKFSKENLDLSYRKSNYTDSDLIITSMLFKLKRSCKDHIKDIMLNLITKRKNKQPIEFPSAGSVFKRPIGCYAGTIIRECGLEGYSIGGAQVSEKHTGFIINKGNASSSDILKLIEYIKSVVYKKIGIILESEVKILKSN
ncbi:MAG: UDP-N-acetylmuramate dehydrogenase [Candidatus Improbicoccus pseudotrichonymphae]|uniref:UDP-N-acetylenolpyruvoylglucosamine reductase n=1 Tax=Candidatus Improbicoccus pseudotrichonymphae TaxID=3033792 RepID=A0AA48IA18_9FIRM|nr:MAG: UDP-N-acetylmuramate dehydrogenase [Candidatus Improbicoccus pseudotrichonymphae]